MRLTAAVARQIVYVMKKQTNRERGALGEQYAEKFLKKQGYKILKKNYHCKLGEIDIIARDGGEIVFVEVKTRPVNPYVPGMYAVDRKKREHILRTAAWYLSESSCTLQPRMDVIEVELDGADRPVGVNHIKAAFIQTGGYARY